MLIICVVTSIPREEHDVGSGGVQPPAGVAADGRGRQRSARRQEVAQASPRYTLVLIHICSLSTFK